MSISILYKKTLWSLECIGNSTTCEIQRCSKDCSPFVTVCERKLHNKKSYKAKNLHFIAKASIHS